MSLQIRAVPNQYGMFPIDPGHTNATYYLVDLQYFVGTCHGMSFAGSSGHVPTDSGHMPKAAGQTNAGSYLLDLMNFVGPCHGMAFVGSPWHVPTENSRHFPKEVTSNALQHEATISLEKIVGMFLQVKIK